MVTEQVTDHRTTEDTERQRGTKAPTGQPVGGEWENFPQGGTEKQEMASASDHQKQWQQQQQQQE